MRCLKNDPGVSLLGLGNKLMLLRSRWYPIVLCEGASTGSCCVSSHN